MRIVAALLAAVVTLAASGQVQAKKDPVTDEERQVVQVFDAPNHTRDEIYSATRMWVAENFESAKAVIEYESKEDGVIVGNGNIPYPCSGLKCMVTTDWRVPFTMKVESKDGRFRLTFTNIHIAWPPSYSSGISTPAADGPVRQRKDLDLIRPKLLEFGPEIVASLGTAKASDDW